MSKGYIIPILLVLLLLILASFFFFAPVQSPVVPVEKNESLLDVSSTTSENTEKQDVEATTTTETIEDQTGSSTDSVE